MYSVETIAITLLSIFEELKASDMHLVYGYPPFFRIDGVLRPYKDYPMTIELLRNFISQVIDHDIILKLTEKEEIDISIKPRIRGVERRYRLNVALSEKRPYVSIRRLNVIDKMPMELGIPRDFIELIEKHTHGVVFITGTTGSGKSTSLASLVAYLLRKIPYRVITLEDPIEYEIPCGIGVITQREVNWDTKTFASGLRAAMRQDPDVILVGEVRDAETAETLLAAAETGHIVLATLHVGAATQIPDRMEGFFQTENAKEAIRQRLLNVFMGGLTQRLVPMKGGGRILSYEFLEGTREVISYLRSRNVKEVREMMSWRRRRLVDSLCRIAAAGVADEELCKSFANFPAEWDDVYLREEIERYKVYGIPEEIRMAVENMGSGKRGRVYEEVVEGGRSSGLEEMHHLGIV